MSGARLAGRELVADVDIAVDVRLVRRELVTSWGPGAHPGVFYYYGPRTHGSSSLVVVLESRASDFRLDDSKPSGP